MVRSMAVLKDMPEAEDRAATLTGLQERLEDLLQPKLLEVGGRGGCGGWGDGGIGCRKGAGLVGE